MEEWPEHWKPVADEIKDEELQRVWEYLRQCDPHVAETVTKELERELKPSHFLYGAEFALVAWDSYGWKEFLFETTMDKAPVVMVHLTYDPPPVGGSPFTIAYRSVTDFIEQEQFLRKKHRNTVGEDEPKAGDTSAKPNASLPLLSMLHVVRRSNNSVN